MNIFLTGACGHIGSHIAHNLVSQGKKVRALLTSLKRTRYLPAQQIEYIQGDVRDAKLMHEAMAGCEAVIHCAALNRFWHWPQKDFFDINVTGTKNMCEAALAHRVSRFVFTSSCDVMGPAVDSSLRDETYPISFQKMRGPLPTTKFLSEEMVCAYAAKGLPTIIIRPTAVIGPGESHGTPPGKLILAYLHRKLPFYYDCGLNLVDARDVAELHVTALSRGNVGEIYLSTGHNIFLHDLFRELEKLSNIPAPTRKIGFRTAFAFACLEELKAFLTHFPPRATRESVGFVRQSWFFEGAKTQQEFQIPLRSLTATVQDTVSWYQKELHHV